MTRPTSQRSITYVKTYETFEDGIAELCNISNIILKLFPEEVHTHDEAAASLIRKIYENIPSVTSEEYPLYYAIDLSADRCSFRTPNHVSFGWKIYFDRETKLYSYRFRIELFPNKQNFNVMENRVRSYGWNLFEPRQMG